MPNSNCLEGMKCPKCESEGPFVIACDVLVLITDEGTEDLIGDNNWDDDSYCECRKCQHSGTVKDFGRQTTNTTLATLVARLKELKDLHESLENDRDVDFNLEERKSGLCDEAIDERENEIYVECFEIAQDIVDLNPYA